MAERDPESARDRGSWPVRVDRLGDEPAHALLDSTPVERLEMVEPLSREAFALAGSPLPTYTRTESPVVVRRLRA